MSSDYAKAEQAGSAAMMFAGNPLDRLEPLRMDRAGVEALRHDPASRFAAFRDLSPLLSEDGRVRWLKRDVIEWPGSKSLPWVFLGMKNGNAGHDYAGGDGVGDDGARFAVDVTRLDESVAARLAGGAAFRDLRNAAFAMDPGEAAILAQARALLNWHNLHQFCPACGGATRLERGGASRICLHHPCGRTHFARVDPVVIMLVVHGDACLVGRQSMFPPGMYSALAGFVEPGETIEEAVRREVMEEAGVSTGRVAYVESQPWPYPSSLMIGCIAEAFGTELTLDPREIEDARWVTRQQAASLLARAADGSSPEEGPPPEDGRMVAPPPIAIAHHLMARWVAGEISVDGTGF